MEQRKDEPAIVAGADGWPQRTDSGTAQDSGQPSGPAESGARCPGDGNNPTPSAGRPGASGAAALLDYELRQGQSGAAGEPLAGRLGASGEEAPLEFDRQRGQSRIPGEKGAQTGEQPSTGPILERTSLPAGLVKEVAFAVKCSEAAAGALPSGNVPEAATLSCKLQACQVPSEATGSVASVGHENSAETGNQPPSGLAEQRESLAPRKLMGAPPKGEGTTLPDAVSGKQGTLQAGSASAEKGNLAVVAPPPSQAAQAASRGSGSRTAPESATVQSPAAASEPGAVRSPGRIDLRVQGQQNERVDIRLVARGSEVQVTVKTASAALTTELRSGLQDLVQTLRDSGYQTEAWRPLPAGSPASNSHNDAGTEQGLPHEGGQGGRESASGWQQENRGDRGRQDKPPRWVEELEASSAGSPQTNWRELSWRQ